MARSIRLSRNSLARIYLESQPTRSRFVGTSPTIYGTNLPNLPLTEYDPPNTPVSPIGFLNVDELFNSSQSSGSEKRKKVANDNITKSASGSSVCASFSDLKWVEKKEIEDVKQMVREGCF